MLHIGLENLCYDIRKKKWVQITLLDTNFIFNNINEVKENLLNQGFEFNSESFSKVYQKRKELISQVESLKQEQNKFTKEISKQKRKPDEKELSSIKELIERIKSLDAQRKSIEEELATIVLEVPNLCDSSVPIGKNEEFNVEIIKHGSIPKFDFKPLDHVQIGKKLNLFDLERASKITGSRFNIYRGEGAKLERALINFMLDFHSKNGYEEIFPPFICNDKSFIGTGNLPKFEEDLFKLNNSNYYLIPTAEVPITNMYADEVIDKKDLPLNFVAYSACFRSEAGSYGKDVKGLIRQHQFNKVELVKITSKEDSIEEHEKLTNDACSILNELELPYRKVLLCTGDTSFSSNKTYDLEVWLPSEERYREISSCSNFKDFQARRANIKIKSNNKVEFANTLNGSGLAVGRTLVAIIENFQQKDGSIKIPNKLQPYLDNKTHIK